MTSNPLVARWAAGDTVFGGWCMLPGSAHAEFIARGGADYVAVDYQHGLIDHSDGVPMLQGIAAGGAIPIARVAWNEPARIMALLDAGVDGLIIPMIETPADAQRAVEAFRYPPEGKRSFGPVRSRVIKQTSDLAKLEDVVCLPMIETAQALESVDAIVAVSGVHGVYIGPNDLSIGLGIRPSLVPSDPRVLDAIARIVESCKNAGKVVGTVAPDIDSAAAYVEQGFDMVTIGTDAQWLANTASATFRDARARFRSEGRVD